MIGYTQKIFRKLLVKNENQFNTKFKGKSGVYFLYNSKDQLIYIGKGKNMINRSMVSSRKYNSFSVSYLVLNISDMHIVECYLICKYKPKHNSQYVDDSNTTINFLSDIKIPNKKYFFKTFDVNDIPVTYLNKSTYSNEDLENIKDKECSFCRKDISHKRKGAKFCSDLCRRNGWAVKNGRQPYLKSRK